MNRQIRKNVKKENWGWIMDSDGDRYFDNETYQLDKYTNSRFRRVMNNFLVAIGLRERFYFKCHKCGLVEKDGGHSYQTCSRCHTYVYDMRD